MKYEMPEMVIETFTLHDVVRTSQVGKGNVDWVGEWNQTKGGKL